MAFADARPLLATLIITAIGFVYMIFRERLFDVSFVLNRAAVYAAISTLLVPLLLLGEYLAQRVLAGGNQTENALVQVGIALLLFVVARLLYERIVRAVDHLLFRERHENEDALRGFARRVALLDDARAIGNQAIQTVCAHTDAAYVALYRRDAKGDYVRSSLQGETQIPTMAGRNDPVVLACAPTVRQSRTCASRPLPTRSFSRRSARGASVSFSSAGRSGTARRMPRTSATRCFNWRTGAPSPSMPCISAN